MAFPSVAAAQYTQPGALVRIAHCQSGTIFEYLPLPRTENEPCYFLKLPLEIRNKIYFYFLVDTKNVIRVNAFRDYTTNDRFELRRLFRTFRDKPDRDDLPGQQLGSLRRVPMTYEYMSSTQKSVLSNTSLALFRVSRQISLEAMTMFFGENLFSFLSPRDILALARPAESDTTGVTMADLFGVLARVPNLVALHLSTAVLLSGCTGKYAAMQNLLKSGSGWMHTLAVARKDKFAAIEIIKLPAYNPLKVRVTKAKGKGWVTDRVGQEEFRQILRKELIRRW